MVTQEVMHSVMQEHLREAAELRRQRQAERFREAAATPRSGRSSEGSRKIPVISRVARIRSASVP